MQLDYLVYRMVGTPVSVEPENPGDPTLVWQNAEIVRIGDCPETVTVRNVPAGAMVTIRDALNPDADPIDTAEDLDGIFVTAFGTVGVYELVFSVFPYIDGQVQVAAT